MNSLAQIYLSSKRDTDQEYTLHLFEKCNLSCGFCWQDHKAMVGVDTVRHKVQPVTEMISEDSHPSFTINVMGGEVFDDSIFNDTLFDDYVFLCTEIDKFVKSQQKHVHFNFVTNLVTDYPDRIQQLLDQLKSSGVSVSLTTSYDAKGRFNKQQSDTFKSNIETLRPYITCVSMLLTKPVIKNLIRGRDEYFEYLYNQGFYIYFDYYTPAEDHLIMAPSDRDLLEVFYYLVDNYPKVHPIKEWIENTENYMSCRTSKLVLPDGTKCTCGNLIADNTQVITFFKSPISRTDNDAIEEHFLNRWNCIECEYFKRCTLGCFTQHNFMKRGQLTECPFKMTFDKITKGVHVDVSTLPTHYG